MPDWEVRITGEGDQIWAVAIGDTTDEAAQRCHVFQSAPDILAALQRLLRANEADYELCPKMDVATAFETNSMAIKQARDAIAKATGNA